MTVVFFNVFVFIILSAVFGIFSAVVCIGGFETSWKVVLVLMRHVELLE